MVEGRPPSLLQRQSVDGLQIFVGVLVAAIAHGLLPAAFFGGTWLLTALGLAVPVRERERPISEDKVIAAEFVQLGKKFDPRKLPDRRVPPKKQRVSDKVAVSKNLDPPKPRKRERREKQDVLDDLLSNKVDIEKDFAEQLAREREGDPEGLEEGTAREAREGDVYRGELVLFFRRGWELPVTLENPDDLVATAAISIDARGRLRAVRIIKSSGNADFDHSVVVRVENLIRAGATIPEPPPGLEGDFYGQTRPFQFHGKHAR